MSNWQSGGVCYETKLAAVSAYVSSLTVQPAFTVGTTSFVGSPSASGTEAAPAVSIAWTRVTGTAAIPAATSVPYVAQPCRLIGMGDAAVMAWLVIGVWAVAYAFRTLKKVAHV